MLRGTGSILDGLPQNDVDIYIPQRSWNVDEAFGKHTVVELKRHGAQQLKVMVEDADTSEVIEFDVFHQVTWRGLNIIDIDQLPAQWVDALGVNCLDIAAEAWLTVLKNVLHGSVTPKHKLKHLDYYPTYPVFLKSNRYRNLLGQILADAAWSASRENKLSCSHIAKARVALLGIRFSENPTKNFTNMGIWLIWRLIRKFVL